MSSNIYLILEYNYIMNNLMDLRNGDCLEILKEIPNKSVDLVFADLPYGQVNCKWDCKIDLELLWKELLRVAKTDATPFFFTCTTKFGYELISSNKKMFRYDLVWAKSNPCGFLQAKKQPMRKHEMLYVFYKKQPAYDISSHKHKFKKEEPLEEIPPKENSTYGNVIRKVVKQRSDPIYEPPLPVSVLKEDKVLDSKVYGTKDRKTPLKDMGPNTGNLGYDPPLPTSVIKEPGCYSEKVPNSEAKYGQKCSQQYDPPLPVSVIKEEDNGCYGENGNSKARYEHLKREGVPKPQVLYDPPLPTSVIKEECIPTRQVKEGATYGNIKLQENRETVYDPPLPTSVLKEDKIKSTEDSTYGKTIELGIPHTTTYDPPLPVSVIKEDGYTNKNGKTDFNPNEELQGNEHEKEIYGKLVYMNRGKVKKGEYDPPLPVSVIKEECIPTRQVKEGATYGNIKLQENRETVYDPPLPVSVIKDEGCYGTDEEYRSDYYDEATYGKKGRSQVLYEPPLPHSLLEIKSIRLKQHSTAKPPDLMKWILKYYTKEGDTILDPTMGSNPMGLACKEMNRDYIGIEKDPEIYAFACKRVE